MKKKTITTLICGICIILAVGITFSKFNDRDNNKVEASDEKLEAGQAINKEELDKPEDNNIEEIQGRIDELEAILNDDMMVLTNREHLLSGDYEPNDLVLSQFEFLDYIETRHLREEAAEAALKMFNAAKEDGFTLLGASGYRSYRIQENLFNSRAQEIGEEEASKYTAIPGASEHQTGLALDILSSDYTIMDEGFENSPSFTWLNDNAYKYGFILRYHKGKEDITGYSYEPWHYRYIGNTEVAEYITKSGITFEEYIAELKNEIQDLQNQIQEPSNK